MMTPTGYTFCCACAHNQGIECDHAGKPHEYCANHDPADYFGTATPRGCGSCAALREENRRLREAIDEIEKELFDLKIDRALAVINHLKVFDERRRAGG